MNRTLLLFALFLVVVGVGLGFYLISLFGFLILIPALMAPSKRPPVPVSAPPKREAKRISPLPQPQPTAAPEAVEAKPPPPMTTPPPRPTDYQSFSPAIFPNSMFSYLSPSSVAPAAQPAVAAKKDTERDELIETGAMLAILKFLLG